MAPNDGIVPNSQFQTTLPVGAKLDYKRRPQMLLLPPPIMCLIYIKYTRMQKDLM